MYVISKSFRFSASHVLEYLVPGHPCTRLHGHNYEVTMYFKSKELNNAGFVIDYRELDVIKKWIDATFDHKHINNVFQENDVVKKVGVGVELAENPSAENIAKFIFDTWKPRIPMLSKVCVKETEKTEACYEQ